MDFGAAWALARDRTGEKVELTLHSGEKVEGELLGFVPEPSLFVQKGNEPPVAVVSSAVAEWPYGSRS